MLTHIERYVLARTMTAVVGALAVIASIIILIGVVEISRDVGVRAEISFMQVFGLTLLRSPSLILQLLPFVFLFGVLAAFVSLNRRSELIAMRAAGVSAWRFLAPSALVGIVLGIFTVTLLNPLGARLYRAFEAEKEDVLTNPGIAPGANGVWLRQGNPDGQVVIHAEGVDPSGTRLQGATFMFFEVRNNALRFTRRMRAETAELKPGFWQLTNLVEATPGGRPTRQTHLAIPTTLDATELISRFVTPATLSFWDLPGFIYEARSAGFAPTRYELKWQSLLAYPLLLAVMAGLGAAFSLQLQRLGNLARWGAAGVGVGLFLFFYSQLAGAFAMTQTVPAIVAAWSAPLAGMFIALSLVAFLEDG